MKSYFYYKYMFTCINSFQFGVEDVNYGNYSRDICVQKNDTSRRCLLDQYSYDYFGERNALTGNREFDVKRFICIEMIETPGQKSEREAIERQEREDDQQRWEREKYQVKQGIEKVTRKRIDKILFDTETHEWDVNTSEFGNIVEGRKDIVVMIEDERKNLFGGYIGETVQLCKAVKTDKCFVYSLRKNGIFNPKRYDVKRGETGYFLNQQNNPLVMSFWIR